MCVKIGIYFKRNIFLFPILLYGVTCLTMEGVMIPPLVLQGDPAELRCLFRLDHDSLYSVSWYKDHEEFYRYVPKANPRQHTYRLDGAKVDQQRSDAQTVILRGAKPAASGVYRCEVSAEAPSFTSVNGEGRMDVVSLPADPPQITGDVYPRDYREGDVLSLNCTAGSSHPPARLRWMVNDGQVPSWFDSLGGGERGASSGLRLRLSQHHFPRGLLAVRCLSTVGAPPLGDMREALILVRGSASSVISLSWSLHMFLSLLCVFTKTIILNT